MEIDMKITLLLSLLFAASFAPEADAKCRLEMPAGEWGKASKEWRNNFSQTGFGGDAIQCKSVKCGGDSYVVSYDESKIRGAGDIIATYEKKGPLHFDSMNGASESSPWYLLEAYSAGDRVATMYSFGKSASMRRKHMALMKKSLRCN